MSKKLDEALRAARALVDDKFRAIGVTKHDKTLGQWWGSAATAKLFEHSEGDASIRFEWTDGAAMTVSYESHEEARKVLARLGFLRC